MAEPALDSDLMEMRLRLPELLKEGRDRPMTAYALSKASKGRISLSTVYRLVGKRGNVQFFDADVLDALCEVLGVAPSLLLEQGGKRKGSKRRKGK